MERQPHKIEVPHIILEVESGELVLNWFNTRIRVFKDAQYNHVEHRGDDDQLKGLRVSQGFMDMLFEKEYPYQFDPVVDESTFNWFVTSEMKNLDDELGEL